MQGNGTNKCRTQYQVCHLTVCASPSPLPFNKHSTLGLIVQRHFTSMPVIITIGRVALLYIPKKHVPFNIYFQKMFILSMLWIRIQDSEHCIQEYDTLRDEASDLIMNQFVEPMLHALNVFFTRHQFSNMFWHTTYAIIRKSLYLLS